MRIRFLFIILIILFLSCKRNNIHVAENTESISKETNHVLTEYDFTSLLHCSEYVWNEKFFITPDYGCLYSPKSKNNFGNIVFYLIPKIENHKLETIDINKLSEKEIKNQFNIIVTLIEPKYLNYNPNADPIYYQKEAYWQKLFKYNENINKWDLLDSLNRETKKDLRKIIDNHLLNSPNIKSEENLTIQKTSEGFQLNTTSNGAEVNKLIDCDSATINKQDKSYIINLFYNDRYGNEWKKIKIPIEKHSQLFFIKKLFIKVYGISAKTGDYEWFEKEVEVNQNIEDFDFNQIE